MEQEAEQALSYLDDLSEAMDYAVVGPRDNRLHEIRTSIFPFNTICHIERDFGDGAWHGCSATLIAPRVVLSAGHCLYNHRRQRAPVRIRVSAGRADRDRLPFGSIISQRYYAPARYIQARQISHPHRRNYDYGIIILPRAFRGIARFMDIKALSDLEMEKLAHSGLITIAGYPADRPLGTLWRHSERLVRATSRRLLYTVDTCPGHSGSPIWYDDGPVKNIIGIHTSGVLDEMGRPFGCGRGAVIAPPGLMNAGVRITPEVLENIDNPLRREGGTRVMQQLP